MDKPAGFVALKTLTRGQPDAASALAEIRAIYFRTTKQTIDNDLVHAIELLKSLPDEDARERATVYMQGLTDMQREWRSGKAAGDAPGQARGKARDTARRKTSTPPAGAAAKRKPAAAGPRPNTGRGRRR